MAFSMIMRLLGSPLILCLLMVSSALALDPEKLEQEISQASSVAQLAKISSELLVLAGNSSTALSSKGFVQVADLFGRAVDKARTIDQLPQAALATMLTDADRFYELCRTTIRSLEAQAGEDEAALEGLYRSDVWYDLNYSLATFRYWQAWLDLLFARTLNDPGEIAQQLIRTERGFQVTAMRILYPGLVYGSWLGLGYVELERENATLAEQRFELLQRAIANDEGNPLRAIVAQELALLAIARGEMPALSAGSSEVLTAQTSLLLTEEAFYLLEQHKTQNTGAIEAGKRLRRVLVSEFIDDALLTRLMVYREQIVGQNIGVLGRLIEVEYAYDYQKYNTVVLKFRDFERTGGLQLPLNFTGYRYHYAVGLYEIQLYQESLQQIDFLAAQEKGVSRASLAELRFIVAHEVYADNPDEANAADLRQSALNYIALAPDDDALGTAWLALARVTQDEDQAQAYLENAARYPELKAAASLGTLRNLAAQLALALAAGDIPRQRTVANQGIQQYQALNSELRDRADVSALAIQMEVIRGEDLPEVIAKIEQLENDPSLAQAVRQLLYWSKLRAFDSLDDRAESLSDFVGKSSGEAMLSWQREEIFRWLLEKQAAGDHAQLIRVAEAFEPALGETPDIQRQLLLLRLSSLGARGEYQRGFELANAAILEYPESGDAWVAYSELAELNGLAFEAERGWATISKSSAEGSPRWLQAMVRRLALQSADGADQMACQLNRKISVYRHLLKDPLLDDYTGSSNSLDCVAAED
jgi:hypothetical protein